ncbi:hypothetical protein [Methanolobus vulcani]|uniref:Uncharacterized protein n=1 Tax=Methanolobus vulcani TaxID=38026 RepID=A0A7Z8KRQ3_9EURY|nr:hypothetical protein [Methanolobus vulcani]TQD27920.1 hypothetical protein FKV42_02340 [Methanolobus vulcani]
MNTFEEFLQDYEAHEKEETIRFITRLDEGKVGLNERYPPKNRFIKLKEPIADPYTNIWGVVPFYGSTLAKLIPKDNKEAFDKTHEFTMGFNSHKIDEMIDFQKETGRIQFVLMMPPTYYKNLDFLEPLLTELKPPIVQYDSLSVTGHELDKKNKIEFETLAEHGFNKFVMDATGAFGNSNISYTLAKLEDYASRYSILKASGYEELADEIGTLMIIDPEKAHLYLTVYGFLISNPQKCLLKPICHYGEKFMGYVNDLEKQFDCEPNTSSVPPEIGKFLLNKITLYPETISGCTKVIQEYDDQDLYKIVNSLNEGVKRNKTDIIEEKSGDMSEILENVWNDSRKITRRADGIKFGISLSLGLIGGVAEGVLGSGLLASLGLKLSDTIIDMQNNTVNEKIAKSVSPNHLVSIYDFKNKHSLND